MTRGPRSAAEYRREGMADACVILVARKIVPNMGIEEWGTLFGLQQKELRDAIERWRTARYAEAGVKAPKAGHVPKMAPPRPVPTRPAPPKLTIVRGDNDGRSSTANVTPTNAGGQALVQCPHCDRQIASGAGLAAHIRKHERTTRLKPIPSRQPTPISFDCPVCEQVFTTEHGVKVHIGRVHGDLVPCRHCHKDFKPAGLRAHERACQALIG